MNQKKMAAILIDLVDEKIAYLRELLLKNPESDAIKNEHAKFIEVMLNFNKEKEAPMIYV